MLLKPLLLCALLACAAPETEGRRAIGLVAEERQSQAEGAEITSSSAAEALSAPTLQHQVSTTHLLRTDASFRRDARQHREILLSSNLTRINRQRGGAHKKNFDLSLSQRKQNGTLLDEHNLLHVSQKNKRLVRDKQNRKTFKNGRTFSRRKVTEEVKEFWDKLDQRELTDTGNKSRNFRNVHQSNKLSTILNNTSVSQSETNLTSRNDSVDEDFPFLSPNYDYAYYYYDDNPLLIQSNSSKPSNNSTISDPKVETRENVSSVTDTITDPVVNTNTENNIDITIIDNVETVIENISVISDVHELNSANTTKANTTQSITLSKKLSDNLIIHRMQGRVMPKLRAEASSPVHLLSEPPSSHPMTAIHSFRNRRLHDDSDTRPRDILKEFPIFRQINKNGPSSGEPRALSLHERIQNHLSSTQSITTEFPANVNKVSDKSEISTTATSVQISLDVRNLTKEIQLTNTTSSLNQMSNNSTNTTNTTEAVHKNVTFSTSKTHTISEISLMNTQTPRFKSQLGILPLGESPFGLAPFGDIPMGETPFGKSPGGLSPLGNITATGPSLAAEGMEGIHHSQTTGSDGSINGDYIVVDPVTGDVNGVRYEAAQDVDPLLVQRILLNFLSLDPRLNPANSEKAPPVEQIATTDVPLVIEEIVTELLTTIETTTTFSDVTEPTEPPEST